ncbi:MAG: ATP-dependent Clp protease ATP-binding subunit, partial [Myxococcales bacterium]|nr:ATP-dependent Clp protease ATP-binding subunit [Myxococcales bacterium]
IEKAHPEVFDLLLAMLGEGRMTDVEGQRVDFTMTIVVMTSNLGVGRAAAPGFDGGRPRGAELVGEVRKHFRPEFFNRIDHVVPFEALSRADILRVVDLELAKASRRGGLTRRGLRLVVGAPARARLAELGFHPTRGARPLRRTIEEKVIGPLAVQLAADRSLRDAEIHVVVEGSDEHRASSTRGRVVIPL